MYLNMLSLLGNTVISTLGMNLTLEVGTGQVEEMQRRRCRNIN